MRNTHTAVERQSAPVSADLSAADMRRALEILASQLAVLDGLLSVALLHNDETANRAIEGAAQLCGYMAGLADATTGGQIRGHVEHWVYGMDYPALAAVFPPLGADNH